jgi:hypothetical protein
MLLIARQGCRMERSEDEISLCPYVMQAAAHGARISGVRREHGRAEGAPTAP